MRDRIRVISVELNKHRVTRVLDGDTVYIEGLGYCRLIGIDAPEIEQPGWGAAKIYLEALIKDKAVVVEVCPIRKTDFYQRQRVMIFLAEININQVMVESGLARVWELKPCHTRASKWPRLTDKEKWKVEALLKNDKENLKASEVLDPLRIGDRMTMAFHMPGCKCSPCRSHAILLASDKIAKQFGYVPCPICG